MKRKTLKRIGKFFAVLACILLMNWLSGQRLAEQSVLHCMHESSVLLQVASVGVECLPREAQQTLESHLKILAMNLAGWTDSSLFICRRRDAVLKRVLEIHDYFDNNHREVLSETWAKRIKSTVAEAEENRTDITTDSTVPSEGAPSDGQ
jgi:hypothetical protein